MILAQCRKGTCRLEKQPSRAGPHPQPLMTLRITASAASQICLLADTFSDLTQIIPGNEKLRLCSIAIFNAWKGLLGGDLGEGIFDQFSNHMC